MRTYGVVRIAKEVIYEKGVAKFTIAHNDYKKNGHFFKTVAFKGTAEVMFNNLNVGDRIFIDGEILNNNYTNKDGVKVYQDQVIVNRFEFLEKKGFVNESAEQVYNDIKPTKEQKEYERLDVNPDDLPF